jgi:hypothetical protein
MSDDGTFGDEDIIILCDPSLREEATVIGPALRTP